MIALLAIAKCALFYVGYGAVDTFLLIPFVLYTFSAYVNIAIIGYVAYTFFTQVKMNSEFSAFLKTNEQQYFAQERLHYFDTKETLVLKQVGKHSLEKNMDTTIKENYVLKTEGILTDNELQLFTNAQPTPAQKSVLAVEALKHQIHILNSLR
jgi:hypothetical protein